MLRTSTVLILRTARSARLEGWGGPWFTANGRVFSRPRTTYAAPMVSLYIANTDNDWFDFLSSETDVTEVNFWQPGAKAFYAIQPGELFVFRLKSPRDKIGGFGVLSNSSILPLQIAWESFGRSNGTASYAELRTSIAKYRADEDVGPATNIGCRILVEPVFFPPHIWMDLPSPGRKILLAANAIRLTKLMDWNYGISCRMSRRDGRQRPHQAFQNRR
jgi:hypothetical protein